MHQLRLRIVAMFLVCACVFSATANAQQSSTVKIGAILPLSGDAATLGTAIKNGISLAYDELEPEVKDRIQLSFEDDKMSPAEAVKAFNNLLTIKGLDAVISGFSGQGNALAPIAERRKIALISISSAQSISSDRKYCFNLLATPEAMGKTSADFIKKQNYKTIAYAGFSQEGMIALKTELLRSLGPTYSFVVEEDYSAETTDFRSFATKLRARGGADIIAIAFTSNYGAFARQIREQGIDTPIFSLTTLENPNEIKTSNGALIDQRYVNSNSSMPDFVARFKQRFPGASLVFAANGYDALRLIALSVKTNPSSDGIAETLRSLKNYSGALGTYSSDGQNRFTLPTAIKIVRTDGFQILE